MNQNLISVNAMVSLDGDKAMAISKNVAKHFKKLHKNILRGIENLDCSENFRRLNFELCYENSSLQNGKPRKFYRMTKNGFMFLVMGFTGKEAARIKEAYIEAFDWMYEQLAKGKAEIIKQYHNALERELASFKNGSQAGKALYQRKLEKRRNEAELHHLENLLVQPDLFINAA